MPIEEIGNDKQMPPEAMDVINAGLEPIELDPIPDNPTQGIPFGLASKLTAVVGSGFGLITAIDFAIDGNLTSNAVTTMVLAAVSFFVLAGGRYAQAAMKNLAEHFEGS